MVFKFAYILWNLPKAISLQIFDSIDCLGQVLQKYNDEVIMTSFHTFGIRNFQFVKLIISDQPAKFQSLSYLNLILEVGII